MKRLHPRLERNPRRGGEGTVTLEIAEEERQLAPVSSIG